MFNVDSIHTEQKDKQKLNYKTTVILFKST